MSVTPGLLPAGTESLVGIWVYVRCISKVDYKLKALVIAVLSQEEMWAGLDAIEPSGSGNGGSSGGSECGSSWPQVGTG